MSDIELIQELMREVQDFPAPGVLFRDITPVLASKQGFAATTRALSDAWAGQVDAVAGMEARGFLLGSMVAARLGTGFVCIRKAGKLPPPVISRSYGLEYGQATLDMTPDNVSEGERILVIDDVLATGGTAEAACELIEQSGGIVVAVQVIVELAELDGRAKLIGRDVRALITG